MTDYVIYKRYENRVGVGQLPDIITKYLSSLPPIIELTENVDEALRFTEPEAKDLSYLIAMDYRER